MDTAVRDATYRGRLLSGLLCGLLTVLVAVPLVDSGYLLGLHVAALVVGHALIWPMGWRDKTLRPLWLLAGLWTVAQVVSNWINGGDQTAAVAYTGLLAMTAVTALAWLNVFGGASPARAVRSFALGWVLLAVMLGAPLDAQGWKYELAVPVAILALAILAQSRTPRAPVVVLMTLSALLGVAVEARSLVAFAAGTVFVMLLRRRPRRLKRMVVIGLLGAVVAYLTYPVAASAGWIGGRAQAQQISYNATGSNFVVENRAETFQAIYIVSQKPLLGVGAKQPLPPTLEFQALGWLDGIGVAITPAREAYLTGELGEKRGYEPHSAVFDAVIQGGVLVLPFWLAGLVLIGVGLARYRGSAAGLALLAFSGLAAAWNALFSPLTFSTQMSLVVALFLAWAAARDGGPRGDPAGVAGAVLLDVEGSGRAVVGADVGQARRSVTVPPGSLIL